MSAQVVSIGTTDAHHKIGTQIRLVRIGTATVAPSGDYRADYELARQAIEAHVGRPVKELLSERYEGHLIFREN